MPRIFVSLGLSDASTTGVSARKAIKIRRAVVGFYITSGSAAADFIKSGGTYVLVFEPLRGVDGAKQPYGMLPSPTVTVGFLATPVAHGAYSFRELPGLAGAIDVGVDAINDGGTIVGTCQDSHGDTLSFLAKSMNGAHTYTTIIGPVDTTAAGANDSCIAVGYAGTGSASCFLFDSNAGTFVSTAIGHPASSQATALNGIRDTGTITGCYISGSAAAIACVDTVSCCVNGGHLATPSGPRRVETRPNVFRPWLDGRRLLGVAVIDAERGSRCNEIAARWPRDCSHINRSR